MKFELFIAHRHLTRRRKTGFISLISLISMGGIAIGVMALIIVLSVMTGFDNELKRKIVSIQPHLRIEKSEDWTNSADDMAKIRALNIPGLKIVMRFIEKQAILRTDTAAQGVVVMGLDTENGDFSIYEKTLVSGTLGFQESVYTEKRRRWWSFKSKVEKSNVPSIVLGEIRLPGFGFRWGCYPSDHAGARKRTRSCRSRCMSRRGRSSCGDFHIGMSDADASGVAQLETAQKFYHMENKISD